MSPAKRILLGVNVDHAATLRQARYRQMDRTCGGMIEPDPVEIALMAEQAGADGITAHLREDRRHMQDRDLWRLRECIKTRLNLEMACTPAMLDFAVSLRPDTACLVPESREEVSTEGGLDLLRHHGRIQPVIDALNGAGVGVSLFLDPDVGQIKAAARTGARYVELHTGSWANNWHGPRRDAEFARLADAAALAQSLGLVVNAGHGISYVNVGDLLSIPGLHEFNIGHSILSRALVHGVGEAVATMRARMDGV